MKHLNKLIAAALLTLFIPFSGCDDKKNDELSQEKKDVIKRALQDGFGILSEQIEHQAQDTTVKDTARYVNVLVQLWQVWDQAEPLRDRKKMCECTANIYRDLGQLIGNCNNGTATLFVQTVAKCVFGGTIPDAGALAIANAAGVCDMAGRLERGNGKEIIRRILKTIEEECKKIK